jgi:hypothetical protein
MEDLVVDFIMVDRPLVVQATTSTILFRNKCGSCVLTIIACGLYTTIQLIEDYILVFILGRELSKLEMHWKK